MNMYVYISDLNGKTMYIGLSDDTPIPRIGESIFLGYNPFPKVLNVLYDYKNTLITIFIEGFIVWKLILLVVM